MHDEPLCRSILVILVVWFLLPRVARLMIHTPNVFCQAEDGIRVADVTGVQTCALPICPQLTYIARMLTGDSGAGEQLFAALVAGTRQMMDEQIDAGVMRDVPDRDVVAAHLATWGVAPLVLGQHLAAALGADEMSGELYRRSTLPLMDVLTHGIYTDDRLFRTAQEVLEP